MFVRATRLSALFLVVLVLFGMRRTSVRGETSPAHIGSSVAFFDQGRDTDRDGGAYIGGNGMGYVYWSDKKADFPDAGQFGNVTKFDMWLLDSDGNPTYVIYLAEHIPVLEFGSLYFPCPVSAPDMGVQYDGSFFDYVGWQHPDQVWVNNLKNNTNPWSVAGHWNQYWYVGISSGELDLDNYDYLEDYTVDLANRWGMELSL